MEILSRGVVVEVVYLHRVSCDEAVCGNICCSRYYVLIKFGSSLFFKCPQSGKCVNI